MGASPLRLQPRRRGVPTLPSLASLLAVAVAASTGCDPREPVMPSPPPTTTSAPSGTPATTPPSSLGTVPGTAVPPARSRAASPQPKFDHTDVQDAVYTMLTRNYRIDDVQLVICPPNRPVVRGTTFRCTATIAGEKTSVPITVTSDKGDYVVGRPQ